MGNLPFSYENFRSWFDTYSREYLEPARDAAVKALTVHLDGELPEIERVRVKISPGRVKGRERVWKKLELDKYRNKVASLDDIPNVIDDLVGLRITCNNKSDVRRVMDIVSALDIYKEGMEPVLCQEQGSYRDYLKEPKESGYRAIHINLCASVPSGLKRKVIICELQVRTLLQDGWGELTHEDTYKPGSTPPALVEMLSRRMADLLATVDDIAQDLREAIDNISSANVEAGSDERSSAPGAVAGQGVQAVSSQDLVVRDAAMRHLRDRLEPLEQPVDLASLAWELSREFGQEISQGWFGYGSFKALLKAAVPDARVSSEPPSYVLPKNFDASTHAASLKARPGIPMAALALKQVDRGLPLLSREDLNAAYSQLAEASRAVDWSDTTLSTMGQLNEMTRRARDLNTEDNPVSRSHLDYIAKALYFSRNLNGPLTKDEIKEAYTEGTLKRLRGVVTLNSSQKATVKKWLG